MDVTRIRLPPLVDRLFVRLPSLSPVLDRTRDSLPCSLARSVLRSMLACAGRRESEGKREPAQSVDRKMGLDRNNRREGNALLASSFFVDAEGVERLFAI